MNYLEDKHLIVRKQLRWLSRKGILTGAALSLTPLFICLYCYLSRSLNAEYRPLDKTLIYVFFATIYASIAVRYLRLQIVASSLRKENRELIIKAIKSTFLLSISWTAVLSILSSVLFIWKKNLLVCALFELSVLFGLLFTFPKIYDIDDWLLLSEFPHFIRKRIF
jgi:hypothetical protein